MRSDSMPYRHAPSNAAIEARHVATPPAREPHPEWVNRAPVVEIGTSPRVETRTVPVSSDFEGFGSFA